MPERLGGSHELDDKDKTAIVEGLKGDRNFYSDKIQNIGGLKTLLPDFDKDKFVGELEDYLMNFSAIPEFKKSEVI